MRTLRRITSLGLKYFALEALNGKMLSDNHIDAIRLNFSHMSFDRAEKSINYFRKNFPSIKIIQDIQGQKWRVSQAFFPKEMRLEAGQRVFFCSEEKYPALCAEQPQEVYIPIAMGSSFALLLHAQKVFMKDGAIEFAILDNQATTQQTIFAQTKKAINIRARKSISIPGIARSTLPALTEKDKKDIAWGIAHQVDIILLSFINTVRDIQEYTSLIANLSTSPPPQLWAKIETQDGYEHRAEIIDHTDGIMIGRGDLIPEMGHFEASLAQYAILDTFAERGKGKECIVATNVLDSMHTGEAIFPSISNMNDMQRSVLAGATGFMLSSEVGYGKQARRTVEMFNAYMSFLETRLP